MASLLLVLNWCAHELQSGSVIHHCGLRAGCGIMDMCFMALMAPSDPGASFLAMMTSNRHVAFMEVMTSSRRAASHRRCGLHVGDGVQQSWAQPSFW